MDLSLFMWLSALDINMFCDLITNFLLLSSVWNQPKSDKIVEFYGDLLSSEGVWFSLPKTKD
jgi:hypothetical protein